MEEALDREREQRKLGTIQETIRSILSEYFRAHGGALVTFKR